MSLPPPFAPSEASDASTSSSSRPFAPHLESDSDDPSFDLEHVHTSTPRKGGHRAHRQPDPRGDRDDDDPLHASDTESLDLDLAQGDIDRRLHPIDRPTSSTTPPLTRRSLLQLSQPRDGPTPFASSSNRLALSFRRGNGDLYAPSPSTGSSTLVDREDDPTRKPGASSSAARDGDDDVTVRRARVELPVGRQGALVDEVYDDDEGTEQPGRAASDDGESSSPRPRRSRVGDLASYVDARMSSSTPRRSPKRIRQTPATPAAPGAYPGSARKPSSFRPAASFPSSSSTSHRPSSALFPPPATTSTGTPSSQIHDAFSRLITGPDGALAHSAERRAALAATSPPPPPPRAVEPPTPHPVGHYAFVPSGSLPVERSVRRRDGGEGGGEGTPSRPSKLESALRHLGEAQREAAGTGRVRDEGEEHFEADGEVRRLAYVDREEQAARTERAEYADGAAAGRSAIDFAMARSFRHGEERADEPSPDDSPSDDADARASQSRRRAAPLRASHSVRFASPPPRRRSPSTSPAQSPLPPPPPPPRTRSRSTTPPLPPPSPTLPPLPPPLEPDSPEPLRRSKRPDLMRRSHSSASPPLEGAAPPARPHSAPSPSSSQRRAPAPSFDLDFNLDPPPPAARQPPLSPPPPARERWTRPSSSTPPRGARVEPPSPRRTPPRSGGTSLIALGGGGGGSGAAAEGDGEGEGEADRSAEDAVQALVGQLAAAVQALTASRAAGVAAAVEEEQAPQGLKRDGELRGAVERRRRESEARWAAQEREMRELEARGGEEAVRRLSLARSASLAREPSLMSLVGTTYRLAAPACSSSSSSRTSSSTTSGPRSRSSSAASRGSGSSSGTRCVSSPLPAPFPLLFTHLTISFTTCAGCAGRRALARSRHAPPLAVARRRPRRAARPLLLPPAVRRSPSACLLSLSRSRG